jgi:hypothetical protein
MVAARARSQESSWIEAGRIRESLFGYPSRRLAMGEREQRTVSRKLYQDGEYSSGPRMSLVLGQSWVGPESNPNNFVRETLKGSIRSVARTEIARATLLGGRESEQAGWISA